MSFPNPDDLTPWKDENGLRPASTASEAMAMANLNEWLRAWAPILVPILVLLGGAGWIQYFRSRRRAQQDRSRTALEEFLRPLERVLKTTASVSDKLCGDDALKRLEYHPGKLQSYFASLPEADPRKSLFRAYVEWLQAENRRAVELVERFYSRIETQEFREKCDELIPSVKEWEIMWKAATGEGPIPVVLNNGGGLAARPYPEGVDKALQAEIAAVKRHALS